MRPFRYDLNQIPYNYTVEVTNKFNGLDLMTECLKNYGQVSNIVKEAVIKIIPQKRNAKGQNGCRRRPYKQLRKEQKAEKEKKDMPSECNSKE